MCTFAPDIGALQTACSVFLRECACPLCGLPWRKAASFPCGHTFCYDCAIATLEGPGISQSECPTCKGKYWKRDLKPNPQMMAVVEHTQRILSVAALQATALASGGSPGAQHAAATDSADSVSGRPWCNRDSLCKAPREGSPRRSVPEGAWTGAAPEAAEAQLRDCGLRDLGQRRSGSPSQAGASRPRRGLTEGDETGSAVGDSLGLQRSRSKGIEAHDVAAPAQAAMRPLAAAADAPDTDLKVYAPEHVAAMVRCQPVGQVLTLQAGGQVLRTEGVGVGHPAQALEVLNTACRPAVRGAAAQPLGAAFALDDLGNAATFQGDVGARAGRPAPIGGDAEAGERRSCLADQVGPQPAVYCTTVPGMAASAAPDTPSAQQAPAADPGSVTAPGEGQAQRGRHVFLGLPPDGIGGRFDALPSAHDFDVAQQAQPPMAASATPLPHGGPFRPWGLQQLVSFGSAPMATPNVQLVPQPRSQTCGGWASLSNSRPPAGTCGGRQQPGSVVSIRRSTPSVNNAYLDFHSLLEQPVRWAGRAGFCGPPDPHPAVQLSLGPADLADQVSEDAWGGGGGGGWEGFAEASWLRCLAALPGPTEQEREALVCELGIVDMFMEELRGMMEELQAGGSDALALVTATGGKAVGRDTAAPSLEGGSGSDPAGGQASASAHPGGRLAPSRVPIAAEDVPVRQPDPLQVQQPPERLQQQLLLGCMLDSTGHAVDAEAPANGPCPVPGSGIAAGPGVTEVTPVTSGYSQGTGAADARGHAAARSCAAELRSKPAAGRDRILGGHPAAPVPSFGAEDQAAGCMAAEPTGAAKSISRLLTEPDGEAEYVARHKRARTDTAGPKPGAALASPLPPPPEHAEVGAVDGLLGCGTAAVAQDETRNRSGNLGHGNGAARGTPGNCSPGVGGFQHSSRHESGAQVQTAALCLPETSPPALAPSSPVRYPVAEPAQGARAAAAAAGLDTDGPEETGGQGNGRRRRDRLQGKRHRSEPLVTPLAPLSLNPQPEPQQHQQDKQQQQQPNATASQRQTRRVKTRERLSAAAAAPAAELAALGPAARRSKPLYVLSSGLLPEERARVKELTRRVRGLELLNDVQPQLTHLVVGLNSERRVVRRTIKYLRAVIQGCWVVGMKWVDACLAAGRLLPEEPFEAAGDTVHEGTPAMTRLRMGRGDPPLFGGLNFCVTYLKGTFDGGFTKSELEALLQAAGGTLVRRPSGRPAGARAAAAAVPVTAAAALFGAAAAADLYETSLCTQQQQQSLQGAEGQHESGTPLLRGAAASVVVLVAPETSIDARRVVREWGCAPVQTQWVYDCVSHYKLLPLDAFTVGQEQQSNTADTSSL